MKTRLEGLNERVLKLVEKAVGDLETEAELDDRSVRTLETVNKIITVLTEREKGRKTSDPMDSFSDDELLNELKGSE